MGESNNINYKHNQYNKQEHDLDNVLEKEKVEILKKINKEFITKMLIHINDITKKNVELNRFFINIHSCIGYDTRIKYVYSNLIKIAPYNIESVIYLSHNFLSIFTDLLFGGSGNYGYDDKNLLKSSKNITYAENQLNTQIMQLIIKHYTQACKKFFSIDITIINVKIINSKEYNSSLNKNLITNCFHLNINGIDVFMVIFVPLSILCNINNKQIFIKNKRLSLKKKIPKKNIILNRIYDIKLNISFELMDFSISQNILNNLSKGNILKIQDPNKVIGYVEKKPIFWCSCKIFQKNYVVFLEKFFKKNLKNKKENIM